MSATQVVALLRGINLGSHNKLAMATLRGAATDLGATDVVTHLQSGNLVAATSLATNVFGEALAHAITATTGLVVPVITRGADEWRRIEAANPYAAEAADDGTKVHLMTLPSPVDQRVRALDLSAFAPDTLTVASSGTEIYLHTPDGFGRSKLGAKLTAGAATRDGTMRNWRTVTAITALLHP